MEEKHSNRGERVGRGEKTDSLERLQAAPIVRSTDRDKTTRKTFSMTTSLADELDDYAKEHKSTSRAISRAVETQLYLAKEVAKGSKVIIRTPDGRLEDFTP